MWTMEGARQRLSVDDQGRISWLSGGDGANRVLGRPLPLLRLTELAAGCRTELIPAGRPAVSAAADRLELTWTTFAAPGGSEVALRCTAAVSLQGEGFAWSLHLETETPVVEALYPIVGGLRGEALYLPHHAGERILDPARAMCSERYRHFAGSQTSQTPEGVYAREITYCGQASMAWMELDGPTGGIYLGAHDPHFGLAGLRAESDGQDLTLALRRYGPATRGTWETPPAVLVPHSGNWRTGAAIYREWITPHLPRPQRSAVADGRPAIGPGGYFKQDGAVRHNFADIPALDEASAKVGIDHLVIAGWERGQRSPEYYPDMELGTVGDLAESCRQVRERGHMVTLHLDIRRFDTASEYYPTLGSRWAVKDERGAPVLEQEREKRYAVICPGDGGWRHYLVDSARWLARLTHCQGLYLGQLGFGSPAPCYDPSHQHQATGEYNQGYMRLLEELQSEATLLLENCGDVYSSRAWASFCWTGDNYDEFFALYRYTFPEHRMINAVQPRAQIDGPSRERIFYRDLERAWLLGSYFWASPQGGFGPGDDRVLAHLSRVTAFRRAAEPYLTGTRYMDTEGLVVDGAKVTRFDGPDYMALAVSNPLGVPGHVLVPDAPDTVTCLELGRDIERPWSKDGRRIILPTAGLSLLILRKEGTHA